jgi:hypothetical protein
MMFQGFNSSFIRDSKFKLMSNSGNFEAVLVVRKFIRNESGWGWGYFIIVRKKLMLDDLGFGTQIFAIYTHVNVLQS